MGNRIINQRGSLIYRIMKLIQYRQSKSQDVSRASSYAFIKDYSNLFDAISKYIAMEKNRKSIINSSFLIQEIPFHLAFIKNVIFCLLKDSHKSISKCKYKPVMFSHYTFSGKC